METVNFAKPVENKVKKSSRGGRSSKSGKSRDGPYYNGGDVTYYKKNDGTYSRSKVATMDEWNEKDGIYENIVSSLKKISQEKPIGFLDYMCSREVFDNM